MFWMLWDVSLIATLYYLYRSLHEGFKFLPYPCSQYTAVVMRPLVWKVREKIQCQHIKSLHALLQHIPLLLNLYHPWLWMKEMHQVHLIKALLHLLFMCCLSYREGLPQTKACPNHLGNDTKDHQVECKTEVEVHGSWCTCWYASQCCNTYRYSCL